MLPTSEVILLPLPMPNIIVIPTPQVFVLPMFQVVSLPHPAFMVQEKSEQIKLETLSRSNVNFKECTIEERNSAFCDSNIDNISDQHTFHKIHACYSDDTKDELAVIDLTTADPDVIDLTTTDSDAAQCDAESYFKIIDYHQNKLLDGSCWFETNIESGRKKSYIKYINVK
jgi:hypothetical protein